MIRAATAFAALLALAACDGGSVGQTNAQQQTELNAIAANTSETAGSEAAQNGDAGQAYRAGARNRPRKY
ncbi:MAG TPA: hypothetical protein VK533_07735 [Sphingomonas sp.]|uniref:hypothetical protein n=1 Tax=Sphingomonas sp. TaxID=28214 RepID=UPI002BAAD96D|nr:hypothetical protein [Sphingomonas sp.]HMI19418.1 hypothetical protein [Sphingomonas sp.]